ncbi:cadherin-like domain-containing protein [Thalassolituus hydrocarboniclasticus]|uniref:Tandem-95 repeat protein n=1 Tax=Thalassolituus hydrocarboniclasticus TaxID=2742796 RepID=A0ABY6A867_9GAMM|nr:cadherin-like domain-containing protein [Thalassolituus hydrocarboniclasticus]UXD87151.1 tandem-95 repeat protein [Thalassolituus hydrocarboniclasticus]
MHCLKIPFSALALFAAAQSYASGIQIVNADGAGEGFNDTTAVSATGGNTATTLGAQRLAVFNRAADILNATFDIAVTVNVNSSFDLLYCDTNSATLGSAGAADYEFIYDGSEWTVYADGLANQLQGSDVTPGVAEITAQFNSGIGNPGCLQSSGWYLGFDDPAGSGTSLLSVVLHEIMHGMGFLSFLNPDGSTGATINGNYVYDPYSKLLYDGTQNARVTTLNQSQRAASTINNGNLLWDGAQTNAQLGSFSAGVNNGRMQMYAPSGYIPGSSVSHFDTAATPNEIMEPQYTEFLDDTGLAKYLLADIGWTLAVAANSAPVMGTISAKTLNEDGTLNVTLSATDADGDSLTYSITSATTELGASISGTTLTIAPQANYNGSGSITVQVSDGDLSDSTSFNVTVDAVNDAPVIGAITAKTLNEDTTLDVILSATDVDSGALTYSITSATTELGASISGTTLTIAPQANYNGSGSITVQVSDGDLSDSTSFNVTVDAVNDAPVIGAITAKTLNEDTTLDVILSATDVDSGALTYSITSATTELGASISGTTLTIAPQANYNGSGSITVQVSDGDLSDSTSFNVTVDAVNDAPLFTSADSFNIANDAVLTITLTASDVDTAAGSLTFGLVNFDSSKIDGSLSGSTLTLTPVAGISGATMVEVSVDDGDITTSQSISVNVLSASNQAPVFTPPAALTLLQETSASVTLNATDADNNSLTYSILSSSAGISASISADQLSISADSGFTGTASISLSVSDGLLTDSAVLAITVLPKFELQQDETTLGNGGTLNAGLNSIALALSGGDGELTTSLFFDGSQQDSLLSYDAVSQSYTLAMPASGAFAGTYTLTVSDGSGFSATYYIERPLRVATNVTPTLALSASQTITIEGAPAGTLLSLSSSSAEVAFSDINGMALTSISAPDDAENFNAASAVLTFNSVSGSSQPVITASGSNLPDGELQLALQPGRTLIISVSDQNMQPVTTAVAALADSRFELWNLPSAANADSHGEISLQLPQENLQLSISADNYLSATLNLDSEQSTAAVTLTALDNPFSLSGIVQASGFDFSNEAPQLTLLFDDDSEETLVLNSISSTSVSYNWTGDLSVKTPQQLQVLHSQTDRLTLAVDTSNSSQNINVTLLASVPQPVTGIVVVSSGGSAGGGALWYLLLLCPIITTCRRQFQVDSQ